MVPSSQGSNNSLLVGIGVSVAVMVILLLAAVLVGVVVLGRAIARKKYVVNSVKTSDS